MIRSFECEQSGIFNLNVYIKMKTEFKIITSLTPVTHGLYGAHIFGSLTNKVFKSVKKDNGDIINFEVLLSVNNEIMWFL